MPNSMLPLSYALAGRTHPGDVSSWAWARWSGRACSDHGKAWTLMQGVVHCMLAAMSALAVVGLFHPLRMLPLLFFELAWKAIWLVVVALPLWQAHQMDADTSETAVECLMAVVFLVVVPWPYVFRAYVASPGDRWR